MTYTTTLSEQAHNALQKRAQFVQSSPDRLAEEWVRERLNLDQYPELALRQGESGWRMGIKGSGIDVYTVVGYSQLGYTPQEIAKEILPMLSLAQVRAALCYYADFPDEIDRILSLNDPDIAKARLYRSLGPTLYYQVTGSSTPPRIIAEAQTPYQDE
jgi:uncharacterized protein (DUF433 family)